MLLSPLSRLHAPFLYARVSRLRRRYLILALCCAVDRHIDTQRCSPLSSPVTPHFKTTNPTKDRKRRLDSQPTSLRPLIQQIKINTRTPDNTKQRKVQNIKAWKKTPPRRLARPELPQDDQDDLKTRRRKDEDAASAASPIGAVTFAEAVGLGHGFRSEQGVIDYERED
ncbi:unnamed protein product [Cyclocybe aegerita]|uniref:Uncharacterized protein n=1 Tax=Cyclocybe aegerita TaxID=1973307 RepID=A0A8S0W7U3_CYCAE|nr:unnamed protein product [Cyclocybe aegerita]